MNNLTRVYILTSLPRNLASLRTLSTKPNEAFEKRKKQKEEEYFYHEQKKQLEKMKKGLKDAIDFHEEQIKKHEREIERQKEHIRDLDEHEKANKA